jgi:hypothetical protein
MARTTSLHTFPNGFGEAKPVLKGVHEAVHVYRDRDRNDFALLFELRKDKDGSRSYGLARAKTLLGPWTTAQDWTVKASHGELLRLSNDERWKRTCSAPDF